MTASFEHVFGDCCYPLAQFGGFNAKASAKCALAHLPCAVWCGLIQKRNARRYDYVFCSMKSLESLRADFFDIGSKYNGVDSRACECVGGNPFSGIWNHKLFDGFMRGRE